jgi:hypothetical protein
LKKAHSRNGRDEVLHGRRVIGIEHQDVNSALRGAGSGCTDTKNAGTSSEAWSVMGLSCLRIVGRILLDGRPGLPQRSSLNELLGEHVDGLAMCDTHFNSCR